MKFLKLVFRNARRRLLRTTLTILGLAIAVMAFSVIRSSVDAWYTQVEASSPNRLFTRNAVSIMFTMPVAYENRISKIDGVTAVSHGQWFGGIYVDPSDFFAQFAVDHENFFDLYPEILIPADQKEAFFRERNAVIVGQKLADRFGWKLGDPIRLTGTIYPGDWDFVIRGIYTGGKENTDESTWYFRFDYLDERMREEAPVRAGQTGWFILQIADPAKAADISGQVDAMFQNSIAETKTETEEAFNLGFVAMASSIIVGLKIISGLVIGIILLVLANTMAMTARERINEYAVMKTLGFRPVHISGLIFGESLFIAILGGCMGILITFPTVSGMGVAMSAWFPSLPITVGTLVLAGLSAIVVGFMAAIFPTLKALRTPIVDGLRIID